MPITVTAAGDRPTPRQKIEEALTRDAEAKEPLSLRVPIHIYDRTTRDYRQLPEVAWNLKLVDATVEEVEAVIEAVGKCMLAIGSAGPGRVMALLTAGEGEA